MKDRHELSCHSGRRVDCMLFCLGDGEGGSTWYYQVKWQLYLSIFHLRRLTYYWGGLNQPPSVLGLMLSKYWALIWYWDHLKNFIAEIPKGPLGMSIGTIWVTQKRSQGPPARGF